MRMPKLSILVSLFSLSVVAMPFVGCATGGGTKSVRINQTLDDATVQTRVKTAILNDPQVGGDQIDVASVNGVVTLSGVIKSPEHEARAADLARKVSGVKDVKTSLKVQGS
jgi:osmotically-inducible protein OsmY